MVRLLLGRPREPRPAQTPSWEPPQVRALPELARGEPTDPESEPVYWELGDGAVVLRGDMVHVLNGTARALWIAVSDGADEDSAVGAVAHQWHAEPEVVRESCLRALTQLRKVAGCAADEDAE